MLRGLSNLVLLATLAAAGAYGIVRYRDELANDSEKAALKDRAAQLSAYVDRLTADRRVAELLVTDQRVVDGVTRTTLVLEEYARDGSPLPAKAFVIRGNEAHLDAMVVQFKDDLVERDAPLRKHSLLLFTRLYGDQEKPAAAACVDPAGEEPDYYKGEHPDAAAFERSLWKDFWHLAEDRAAADQQGVRVAEGQGVWWPAKPGVLYSVTTRADGGMNLTDGPVPGIYRAALAGPATGPGR